MIKQTIFLNRIYLTGKNLHQSRFSIPPGILGRESEVGDRFESPLAFEHCLKFQPSSRADSLL